MATHKAFRLHSYGGPECITLDDVPALTPGKGQVLIRVSKVGMNPFDWKIREGYVKDHMPLQLPAVLGVDFVGTVVTLGEGCSRFAIGDRVMTMSTTLGAFAEYIVIDENILARVPSSLDDVSAATLPIPALTAMQSLRAAGAMQPGMQVLIHGASGTTGAFAVQFAKAAGATVIGTASCKNREYVLGLGADDFIDYQAERFEDRVREVDLVLDYVLIGGSMSTTDRSWAVLKEGGAIVSVADPTITTKIPAGFRGFFPSIQPNVEMLESVAEQLAAKKIKSKVARVFSRDNLIDAMEMNKAGGSSGRLIVDFEAA